MATAYSAGTIAKPSARRVFISYARKDGRSAADGLRQILETVGFEVWLDTERIAGGASWSKEIEKALDDCDVLIAVITPGSYVSEVCRAEQIWALDQGKTVIPVLLLSGAPVPIYLKGSQWRKYPDQQNELLADLGRILPRTEPDIRALRYDTVPNLPQNYVVRGEALVNLRELVFAEGRGTGIAVTAMAGMGAIGKTVLATALCRDIVVQRAFPDGIAWITIGREWDGDFVNSMREVARALGDDLHGYDTKQACVNRYRTILREKASLVVIDDVWSLDHLRPLLVDAPRSRFLFTTRDAGIANAITNRRCSANLLSESEARELLAKWSDRTEASLPPEAEQIIQACGVLAGALAQVGACLRDVSPSEWQDMLVALERADITAIEERLPSGQESFFKSLAVSIDALSSQMRERYLGLSLLVEDVPAPLTVLRTLWGVDEAEARRTARSLVERSLAFWKDPAEPMLGISLHDLQLGYLRASFGNLGALQSISEAMRLSAQVTVARPDEFASQMVGRLLMFQGVPEIALFTNRLAMGAPSPWLRPIWATLNPPGTGLVRMLTGHSDWVSGVAQTIDGRRALSASLDKTLKLWDLNNGQVLLTLEGHSRGINGVALTLDGRFAVSASQDKTVRVWDLENGRELRTLDGHLDWVSGVALTMDGRFAVSASQDRTLKIWDLGSGQCLRTLVGHTRGVNGVAIFRDGRRVVSASQDETLKVWDLQSGIEIQTLAGHSGQVTAVAVTDDGKYAVSASLDNTLKIWDLASGLESRTLEGHTGPVKGVTLTQSDRTVISGSADKTLKVWDLKSGEILRTLMGHSAPVVAVAATKGGELVASASQDCMINLWTLNSIRQSSGLAGNVGSVVGLAVSPNRRCVVSTFSDSALKVWDLDDGHEVRILAGHSARVVGVAVTPDSRRVVSASRDSTLKVWDLESGLELRTLKGHLDSVNAVAVSTDGHRAVSASMDCTLKIWDLDTGRELQTLAGHSDGVNGLALTPDGLSVVSCSWDRTLKVWDLRSGRELLTLSGHADAVCAVAVTADGYRAISASRDKSLKVWDIKNGEEQETLNGHLASVWSVAVTVDGRRAVSASLDKTLKVWDLSTAKPIAGFTCESGAHCCVISALDEIFASDQGGRLYRLRLVVNSGV